MFPVQRRIYDELNGNFHVEVCVGFHCPFAAAAPEAVSL